MVEITRAIIMDGQISRTGPQQDLTGTLLDPQGKVEGLRLRLLPETIPLEESPFTILGPTGGTREPTRDWEISPEWATQFFSTTEDATGHLQLSSMFPCAELLVEAALKGDLEATRNRWSVLKADLLRFGGVGHLGHLAVRAVGGQWSPEHGVVARQRGAMMPLQIGPVTEGSIVLHPFLFYGLMPAVAREKERLLESGRRPINDWERMLLSRIPKIWQEQPLIRGMISQRTADEVQGDTDGDLIYCRARRTEVGWVIDTERYPLEWGVGAVELTPLLPTESWHTTQCVLGHVASRPKDHPVERFDWTVETMRQAVKTNSGLKAMRGPGNNARFEHVRRTPLLNKALNAVTECSIEKRRITADQWQAMHDRIVATGRSQEAAQEFLVSVASGEDRAPTFPELAHELMRHLRPLPQNQDAAAVRENRKDMVLAAITDLHEFDTEVIRGLRVLIKVCRAWPTRVLNQLLPGVQLLERESLQRSQAQLPELQQQEDGLVVLACHYGVDELMSMLIHDMTEGATQADLEARKEEIYRV